MSENIEILRQLGTQIGQRSCENPKFLEELQHSPLMKGHFDKKDSSAFVGAFNEETKIIGCSHKASVKKDGSIVFEK
jgi:hypothetical protein